MDEDGKRMSLYGKNILTPQEKFGFWKSVVWVSIHVPTNNV